ncbi:MAG: two-component regulator propeller domain-containing protein, partial [Opitutales bacterium]
MKIVRARRPKIPAWLRPACLWLLCLGGGVPVEALDPSQGIHQYNIRSWGRDFGLPASAVNDLAFTSCGRLWLATSRGLVHFDGLDFERVLPGADSTYAGKLLRALAPGEDGGLWFGMENAGVGYFDGHVFAAVPRQDAQLSLSTVRSVLSLGDGSALVAGYDGLDRVNLAGVGEAILSEDYLDVTALYRDARGRVWIGTAADGLFLREGSRVEPFPVIDLEEVLVWDLVVDAEDTLWVATQE